MQTVILTEAQLCTSSGVSLAVAGLRFLLQWQNIQGLILPDFLQATYAVFCHKQLKKQGLIKSNKVFPSQGPYIAHSVIITMYNEIIDQNYLHLVFPINLMTESYFTPKEIT